MLLFVKQSQIGTCIGSHTAFSTFCCGMYYSSAVSREACLYPKLPFIKRPIGTVFPPPPSIKGSDQGR